MNDIVRYVAEDGSCPFESWLGSLRDTRGKARVLTRLDRLALGCFGDVKALGDGVSELRIDVGPGYRVYFAIVGKQIVLLLYGGDKNRQREDVAKAKTLFEEYKRRLARESQ